MGEIKRRRTKKDIEKEKGEIYKVLLKKSPMSVKEIFLKLNKAFPKSTTKSTINPKNNNKKYTNPEYNLKVSKYIQTHIYNKQNNERTLCGERKFFKLNQQDIFEYREKKVKFSAKQFIEDYGFKWGRQVHSYYFATPRTYFIKTKIFDEIIRSTFLKSKEIRCYINNTEKIEMLLKDAEKIMTWIEITPSIKDGYKGMGSTENFSQYIIDLICEGKKMRGVLFLITDYVLAPILEEIEKLLSLGNLDYSYINTYRIFRKKLYEGGFFELPEKYSKKPKMEEFYEKDFDEKIEGLTQAEILKLVREGKINLSKLSRLNN